MNNNPRWRRNYITIWTGQTVSIFTSAVIQMSLIWYLTQMTSSAAVLALTTLAGFLPKGILGPFTGVYIDRYNKKLIMILSDCFVALVALVLAVLGHFMVLPVWPIILAVFIRGIGNAFHDPCLQAVTPFIVPREYLTRAAGYAQTFQSLSFIFSPVVAAALFSVMKINQILFIDILGAAMAVITLCLIPIPSLRDGEEEGESFEFEKRKPHMLREAMEGLQVLRKEKGLTSVMFITSFYAMIYFPIGTLYPLISMSYFKGTFKEAGAVEVIFALGTITGGILLSRWGDRLDKIKTINKSIGGMGLGLFITGLLPANGIYFFMALAFGMGVTIPFYYGVLTSLYQSKIAPEFLGRVLTLSSSLSIFAMPLGLILAGSFAEVIGVNRWFFLSGILALLLAFISSILPSHRGKREEK